MTSGLPSASVLFGYAVLEVNMPEPAMAYGNNRASAKATNHGAKLSRIECLDKQSDMIQVLGQAIRDRMLCPKLGIGETIKTRSNPELIFILIGARYLTKLWSFC